MSGPHIAARTAPLYNVWMSLTDEQLMLKYCEGDLDAFKALYGRHRSGLYRFLSWRSPRADWVDEVFQDAWASLHQARSRYEPVASFRTFLFQIARNRLVDLMRQHQPVLAGDLGDDDAGEPLLEHIASADGPGDGEPEAALEARQQNALLHRALAALPPEQKEALVLQQFSGLSLAEIADVTGASAETVKSRLRYAMGKLRNLLAQEGRAA